MPRTDILPTPGTVASLIRSEVGQTSPPLSVEAVVARWKDLRIVYEAIDGEGYLLPLGKFGTEIIVRQSSSRERRRFTIAHELGHWILGISERHRSGVFMQPHVRHEVLEKWCDSFAAELLMPADWLFERLGQNLSVESLRRLSTVAKELDVSLNALHVRISALYGVKLARAYRAHGVYRLAESEADHVSLRDFDAITHHRLVVDRMKHDGECHLTIGNVDSKVEVVGFESYDTNHQVALFAFWLRQ